MKSFLLATFLVASSSTFAAATGTLIISGTISPVNDLTITPTVDATNLNIIAGETAKLVASATETSNSLTGYKIRMKSLNSSKLVNTVNATYHTNYTISYNGGSYLTLSNVDQDVKNVSSLSGLTTQNSDIKVNVTAYPTGPAGVYSDTITVSIIAN